MVKRYIILLFLIFSIQVRSNINPWVSLSSLWGQGGAGLSINKQYFINYYYVFEWEKFNFEYNEINVFKRNNNFTYGFKYRNQLNQDEYAPYIGNFIQYKLYYPITLYNEIEYRENPAFYEKNYLRTRHILSLYASDSFYNYYGIRPFIAFDSFINWETKDFEQNRIQIGYFMYVNDISVRFYYIPWREGDTELNWDDQNNFGVNIQYNF